MVLELIIRFVLRNKSFEFIHHARFTASYSYWNAKIGHFIDIFKLKLFPIYVFLQPKNHFMNNYVHFLIGTLKSVYVIFCKIFII